MSLVSYASIWTNDEETNASKKRTPSMRRTQKKPVIASSIIQSIGEPEEYTSNENSTPINDRFKEDIAEQDSRQSRVSQLVDKLSNSNDGNALADFKPLSNPILNKKTDIERDEVVASRDADVPLSYQSNPMQIPPPEIRRTIDSNYSPNLPNLGNIYNSTYQRTYDIPKIQPLSSYYKTAPNQNSALDEKLMEKINYMIHLLEQQHDEKTSNITEEFILYTFLGVFIIFIVDSFARAGKYTR
jgi:hypothetical protein